MENFPMSFNKLLKKVEQAEDAVEAEERRTAADWRQFKRSWRASWSPGRIVLGGLVSGFMVGRIQPGGKAISTGTGILRMLASLAALVASTQAQAAAGEAEEAAETAEDTAESAAAAAGVHSPTATAEAFEP